MIHSASSQRHRTLRRGARRLATTAGLALLATEVLAGSLTGTVTAGGTAIDGAIVSVVSEGIAESVYTDASGHYALSTPLAGKLQLRVRKRYHRDDLRDIELGATDSQTHDIALTALTDPQALSDDHPSLSHFSRIAFDKDEKAPFSRANFARDCLSCHSLGNSFTRWPRPPEAR